MNGANFLLNGNIGSVSGPILKKELPIVSSLKFKKPFKKRNGKIKWQFREFFNQFGVYVVASQHGKVIYIGSGRFCLYRAMVRFFEKRSDKNYSMAVLLSAGSKVFELRSNLKKELRKIPYNNSFQKLKPFLKNSKKPLPIDLLQFKKPFKNEFTKDGRKMRTFMNGFSQRAGVYIIEERRPKEKWERVYVGCSQTKLAERMYHHFYPAPNHPYLIEYSKNLKYFDYRVALIEISPLGKTKENFKAEIKNLEKRFITELNPRDNKRGKTDEDYPYEEEMKKLQAEYRETRRRLGLKEDEDPF